jgi:hypothetical protein
MIASSTPESSNVRRLAVSDAGLFAATVDAGCVTVFDSGLCSMISEIGIAGSGDANDVAFVGAQPRLVVLARAASRTLLHVIDPTGPRKLGELVLPAGSRIGAVGGDQVFVLATPSGIIDVSRTDLQFAQISVRTAVTAASALGPDQFLLASAGALEEWTTVHNLPKPTRRLRFGSPIEAQRIGGNAQRVWVLPRRDPDRIEVISLGNRSTRTIQLPEPAARVAGHASGNALIAIGAGTASAYVVNLAKIEPPARIDHGPVHDAVWFGPGRSLLIWPVDRSPEVVASPCEPADADREPAHPIEEPVGPPRGARPVTEPTTSRPARVPPEPTEEVAVAELRSGRELLDVWRQRLRQVAGPGAEAGPVLVLGDALPEVAELPMSEGWRGTIATWARAMLGRSRRPFPALDPSIFDEVLARLGLEPQRAAVGLLYGARLLGSHGVAAYDMASAVDWRWNDILAGALLATGAVTWRADRLHLAAEVVAALDERPPITGVLVGDGGSAEPIRTAVIAPTHLGDDVIARWAADLLGRCLFTSGPGGQRRAARFSLEASARGLVPFLRVGAGSVTALPLTCVVAVPDEAIADQLALDVRATWRDDHER